MISAFLAPLTNRIMLAIIAALIVLLTVQTARIEGFKVWPIAVEGWKPKAERLQADLDNVKAAQVVALAKAQAAKDKAEQNYRTLAENTDDQIKQARSAAMASAERYIAAHRVRPQAADRSAGGAAATPEDQRPESGDRSGAAPILASRDFVTVTPDDIRICTENTVRLESVREWALGLTDGGD